MYNKELLNEHYLQLKELSEYLKKLEFKTMLYNADKDVVLPTLLVSLKNGYKDMNRIMNLAFSPYEKDELVNTKYLQLFIPFNFEITEKNKQELSKLCEYIISPIGHFAFIQNQLGFRYVYSIPQNMSLTDNTCIETIFFFVTSFDNFEQHFSDVADGKLTAFEALKLLS